MKLREKIFLLELAIFMFLALGIVGNNDLGIPTSSIAWIFLIITGGFTFAQMKYIENCEEKEDK